MSVGSILEGLKKLGYAAMYKSGTLTIEDLPTVVQNASVLYSGSTTLTALVRFDGQWFIPLSNLIQALQLEGYVEADGTVDVDPLPTTTAGAPSPPLQSTFTLSVQAPSTASTDAAVVQSAAPVSPQADTVTFVQQDGELVTMSVPLTGSGASVTLAGRFAELIGYNSPSAGWTGMAVQVTPQTVAYTLPVDAKQGKIVGIIGTDSPAISSGGESVLIRNTVTRAEYRLKLSASGSYSASLPYGLYEVWSIRADGQTEFVGSRFLVSKVSQTIGTIHWRQPPTNGIVANQRFIVMAQDSGIDGMTLMMLPC